MENLLPPDLRNFLKFPSHGFCKAANVMRKSEVEVKTKIKMEGTCWLTAFCLLYENLSSNIKDHIK